MSIEAHPDKTLSWEAAVRWLRSQPQHAELVKTCFLDDPLIEAARRYHASTEWNAVRALLPPVAGRALDVGAGRGIASYALASDGWQTTALEPDASDLVGAGAVRSLADEANLEIRVVQDWGESLPFEDGSFDLVLGRQVLHHARDLPALCREIGRVLKPGGTFLATREHVISRRGDLAAFLDEHPTNFLHGTEHAYLLSEYQAAICSAGIELTGVINPLESDINLYPETRSSIKKILAAKLRWPLPDLIPGFLMGWLGGLLPTPGRVYTFVGRKNSAGVRVG